MKKLIVFALTSLMTTAAFAGDVTVNCSSEGKSLTSVVSADGKTAESQLNTFETATVFDMKLVKLMVLKPGDYFKNASLILVEAYSKKQGVAYSVSAKVEGQEIKYIKNQFRVNNQVVGTCSLGL